MRRFLSLPLFIFALSASAALANDFFSKPLGGLNLEADLDGVLVDPETTQNCEGEAWLPTILNWQ